MLDETDPPGAIEVALKLGADCLFSVDSLPEKHPILEIAHPGMTVLVMPFGASEGGPVTREDCLAARELCMAAARYWDELDALYRFGNPLPPGRRRPVKAVPRPATEFDDESRRRILDAVYGPNRRRAG